MRIEVIKHRLGSRVITNTDILTEVEKNSPNINKNELNKILEQIEYYLNYTGAKERRWLAPGETPIELLSDTIKQSLAESGYHKNDIDLIIHVGIGRGFLEPGQSHFVAKSLDMKAECFDILDACNSWARGMYIAYNFIRTGAYQRIVIINTECNMIANGIKYPTLFQYENFDQIFHSFSGLTSADGVAATILSPDNTHDWEFQFKYRTDHADLCTVPLSNYQSYCQPSDRLGINGLYKGSAFMREMHAVGTEELKSLMAKNKLKDLDWLIPHGHSWNAWVVYLKSVNLPINLIKWNTYPMYGNLASACVPISLSMGMEADEIKRGHNILTAVPSAGLSFSTISFTL